MNMPNALIYDEEIQALRRLCDQFQHLARQRDEIANLENFLVARMVG